VVVSRVKRYKLSQQYNTNDLFKRMSRG